MINGDFNFTINARDCAEYKYNITTYNIEDAKRIEALVKELNGEQNPLIHVNGYIFDSLMFRYMKARERDRAYSVEVENKSPQKEQENYCRDVLRFREILEEIMPNHD